MFHVCQNRIKSNFYWRIFGVAFTRTGSGRGYHMYIRTIHYVLYRSDNDVGFFVSKKWVRICIFNIYTNVHVHQSPRIKHVNKIYLGLYIIMISRCISKLCINELENPTGSSDSRLIWSLINQCPTLIAISEINSYLHLWPLDATVTGSGVRNDNFIQELLCQVLDSPILYVFLLFFKNFKYNVHVFHIAHFINSIIIQFCGLI